MSVFDDLFALLAEPDGWMVAAMIGVAYCAGWLTGDACGFARGVRSMVTFVTGLNRARVDAGCVPPRHVSRNSRPAASNHVMAIHDDRRGGVG
jgi:hypothetical protein